MKTAYGASTRSLNLAFAPIELTAISHGYLIEPTTPIEQAAAVLAAELLSRVCALDSLEHSSRLTPPAREALHAVFLLATGSPVAMAQHAQVASNFTSLTTAEKTIHDMQCGVLAGYIPEICEPAYRCLVYGSEDPRLAAAADALLPYIDQGEF